MKKNAQMCVDYVLDRLLDIVQKMQNQTKTNSQKLYRIVMCDADASLYVGAVTLSAGALQNIFVEEVEVHALHWLQIREQVPSSDDWITICTTRAALVTNSSQFEKLFFRYRCPDIKAIPFVGGGVLDSLNFCHHVLECFALVEPVLLRSRVTWPLEVACVFNDHPVVPQVKNIELAMFILNLPSSLGKNCLILFFNVCCLCKKFLVAFLDHQSLSESKKRCCQCLSNHMCFCLFQV